MDFSYSDFSYSALVNLPVNQPSEYGLLSVEEQEALQKWIDERIIPCIIKTYNHSLSSYSLKHYFEREVGIYVSNGAFKGAMLEAQILPKNYGDLNWIFKISKRFKNLYK